MTKMVAINGAAAAGACTDWQRMNYRRLLNKSRHRSDGNILYADDGSKHVRSVCGRMRCAACVRMTGWHIFSGSPAVPAAAAAAGAVDFQVLAGSYYKATGRTGCRARRGLAPSTNGCSMAVRPRSACPAGASTLARPSIY